MTRVGIAHPISKEKCFTSMTQFLVICGYAASGKEIKRTNVTMSSFHPLFFNLITLASTIATCNAVLK
jgi:hypothetical protein